MLLRFYDQELDRSLDILNLPCLFHLSECNSHFRYACPATCGKYSEAKLLFWQAPEQELHKRNVIRSAGFLKPPKFVSGF